MPKEKKMFDFIKNRKLFLFISLGIMLVGVIFNIIFGTKMDVTFKGGTIFSYSYTGEVNADSIEKAVKDATDINSSVNLTSDISGNEKQFTITISDDLENKFVYSYTGDVDTETVKSVASETLGVDVNVEIKDDLLNIAPVNSNARITEEAAEKLTTDISSAVTGGTVTLVYSNSATGLKDIITDALTKEFGTKAVYNITKTDFDTQAFTTTISEKLKIQVNANIEDGKLIVTPKVAAEAFGDKLANITEEVVAVDSGAKLESNVDNALECIKSNTVKATVGKGFFVKCMFAVVFGAILVTVYIGIRFRKIGGVSAAVFAMLALLHDCIIAYFVYVIFGISLDSNFIAVILTLLGYSLNDTIVIYDRIRENEKLYGNTKSVSETVNISVNQCFTRNIYTSLATFGAIAIVCIVALLNGITSIISFAFPMAIGIVAGCYSSVLLSSPFWAWWREKKLAKHK